MGPEDNTLERLCKAAAPLTLMPRELYLAPRSCRRTRGLPQTRGGPSYDLLHETPTLPPHAAAPSLRLPWLLGVMMCVAGKCAPDGKVAAI
jgi:hypothetical protein